MINWPLPKTLKQLRGFLGITSYYQRFVRHYAMIAAPLTELLKKDSFRWNDMATASFESLKKVLFELPVLSLPDFNKDFVVETDASKTGLGGVLMQDSHPIAYFSKKIGPRMQSASTYVRELFAITEATVKWRQFLLGRPFVLRTDHKSLKYLLTQVVQTPEQQYFLRKLLGYQFVIKYKSSIENLAVDSLSRMYEETIFTARNQFFLAVSSPNFDFLDVLRRKNETLEDLLALHKQVQGAATHDSRFSCRSGYLMHQG